MLFVRPPSYYEYRMERKARPCRRALSITLLLPRNGGKEDVGTEAAIIFGAVDSKQTHFPRLHSSVKRVHE